jgi:DNA segregation ATPase FtsK/SpoIIIE, S-DNA-T family
VVTKQYPTRDATLRVQAEIIETTLRDLGSPGDVVAIEVGPRVVRFGVRPGYLTRGGRGGTPARQERVRVARLMSAQNDLALALGARGLRVEGHVPGKNWIGIEVPRDSPTDVGLAQCLRSDEFKSARSLSPLAVPLGRDLGGGLVTLDLARAPHLLIAGATGSGKSVCVNAILATLIAHTGPADVRLLLVDPKRVEMAEYASAPHLLGPVVVDPPKAITGLTRLCAVMDARYETLSKARVKNIASYNKRSPSPLPYLVCVIDELADLMMTAGEEVESQLCRLAQLGRAGGIHLVVATQRPSVDVITGLIKANFPSRVAFAVASQVDSRTILDAVGAEKLLGRGDMLYSAADAMKPVRLQGVYADDRTITRLVKSAVRAHGKPAFDPDFADLPDWTPPRKGENDPLLADARRLADEHGSISVSYLQRKLRIGQSRAARLLALVEEDDSPLPDEFGG